MSRSGQLQSGRIHTGDALHVLRTLPDQSVDMVLTSPPYFRLRDYQIDGQLGLEPHVDDWATQIQAVASELHRVLKDSGTFWLNLGDTYSTHAAQGSERKSLLLAPERVALGMTDGGWILRNKIIWAKANPMPTSVRDRLNTGHEYLYVFARQAKYHFDLDAIRVPHTTTRTASKNSSARAGLPSGWRGPNGGDSAGLGSLHAAGSVGHPLGKNPGDVWRIPSSNYRGGHHATFPLELARRAIRAGCPEGGVVLDPFIGAGTTAVAAEELGRQWLGIDLNPDFAAHALSRVIAARPTGSTRASPEDQAA